MSRDIKFRAWDGKKVFNFVELTPNSLNMLADKPRGIKELMQYTGLNDKNGVEIYEGDIVEYSYWFANTTLYTDLYRVEFINGSFILRDGFININNKELQEVDYGLELKVIGNIYENPELLEN